MKIAYLSRVSFILVTKKVVCIGGYLLFETRRD